MHSLPLEPFLRWKKYLLLASPNEFERDKSSHGCTNDRGDLSWWSWSIHRLQVTLGVWHTEVCQRVGFIRSIHYPPLSYPVTFQRGLQDVPCSSCFHHLEDNGAMRGACSSLQGTFLAAKPPSEQSGHSVAPSPNSTSMSRHQLTSTSIDWYPLENTLYIVV